jgi:UDP-N-acetylmuramate dehydrogenase
VRVDFHAPLAPLTTLRLGGVASKLVTADREADVVGSVDEADRLGERCFVLGGGSNLVVSDEPFDGTVVRIATRGVEQQRHDEQSVLVTASAGEPWDEFVAQMVADGLAGLECLSGIPGCVGAVPMQNVGAYGQDVSETIVSVRAYDRTTRQTVDLPASACAFSYRSSAFRGRDRHVILSVTFRLNTQLEAGPVRYLELSRALGIEEGGIAPMGRVRECVLALRKGKGMVLDSHDPDTASAGSFFTNPILSAEALSGLRERVEDARALPVFPESHGRFKVSAAWLIERAGFRKGHLGHGGRVGVSTKHALALTNRGGATTRELLALAKEIRDGVRARFGVTLEPEPVFVGVSLDA